MAAVNNTVRVTLKMRNDLAANWTNNNPTLAPGEFGLENNSFLLKIGDGVTPWNSLRYLNKIDPKYLKNNADGTITFSDAFLDQIDTFVTTDGGQTLEGPMQIDYGSSSPLLPNDIVNKAYVDAVVANAGHLKREIVFELPLVVEADPDTIYMVKDNSVTGADKYKEYMLIGNTIVQIGDTSVNLANLVKGGATAGNLITVDSDGFLIDSGLTAGGMGTLQPGTASILGGVKSSILDNYIKIDNEGFMTLNRVSTSLLYVPDGDTLILEGGNSAGGVVSG